MGYTRKKLTRAEQLAETIRLANAPSAAFDAFNALPDPILGHTGNPQAAADYQRNLEIIWGEINTTVEELVAVMPEQSFEKRESINMIDENAATDRIAERYSELRKEGPDSAILSSKPEQPERSSTGPAAIDHPSPFAIRSAVEHVPILETSNCEEAIQQINSETNGTSGPKKVNEDQPIHFLTPPEKTEPPAARFAQTNAVSEHSGTGSKKSKEGIKKKGEIPTTTKSIASENLPGFYEEMIFVNKHVIDHTVNRFSVSETSYRKIQALVQLSRIRGYKVSSPDIIENIFSLHFVQYEREILELKKNPFGL